MPLKKDAEIKKSYEEMLTRGISLGVVSQIDYFAGISLGLGMMVGAIETKKSIEEVNHIYDLLSDVMAGLLAGKERLN